MESRCERDWNRAKFTGRLGWLVLAYGENVSNDKYELAKSVSWPNLSLRMRKALCLEWQKWEPHDGSCWK